MRLLICNADQHKIVDIARVPPHLELSLDEVIEAVEVDQPEKLRQQIANWHACFALGLCEHHDQIHQAGILDLAFDQSSQNIAIQAVVIPANIQLQHVAVARHLL